MSGLAAVEADTEVMIGFIGDVKYGYAIPLVIAFFRELIRILDISQLLLRFRIRSQVSQSCRVGLFVLREVVIVLGPVRGVSRIPVPLMFPDLF